MKLSFVLSIKNNPMTGPGKRNTYRYCSAIYSRSKLISSILNMVILNPIQVTMVSAVPFDVGGALCATRLENIGESAITTNPQKIRKPTKPVKGK